MEEMTRYIFGEMEPAEARAFEEYLVHHPEARAEVLEMQDTLERVALEFGKNAGPGSKGRFLANIDAEREEELAKDTPPILNANSKAEDYKRWTDLPENQPPPEFDNLFYIPISQTEEGASIIVWIKDHVPEEVHNDSIEKFLVLEGSCEITFGGEMYSLKAGDYLSIPLYHPHVVNVTSEITCKLIVQRIAA